MEVAYAISLSAICLRSDSGMLRNERLWTLKSVNTSGRVVFRWKARLPVKILSPSDPPNAMRE